jgi:hypothetical protein
MNRIDCAQGAGRAGATGSTAGSGAATGNASGEGGSSGSSSASSVGRGMQVSLQTSRTAHDDQSFVQPMPMMLVSRAACGFARSNASGKQHTVSLSDAHPACFCSDLAPTVTWSRDDRRMRAYDVNDA